MLEDVRTVLWKEWRERRAMQGRGRLGKVAREFGYLPGLVLPLQIGRAWVETPVALVTVMVAPIMVFVVIADAIAGERERRTLETLLASRLPDCAILYGKLAAAVAFALIGVAVFIFPSLVIINLIYGRGHLLLYPLPVWIGVPLPAPLTALLMSAVGVRVSMRAPTVRQASLTLSLMLMLVFVLGPLLLVLVAALLAVGIGFALSLAPFSVPHDPAGLADVARRFGWVLALAVAAWLLLAANLIILAITTARFTRPELMLD
jgi:ABC-2 type transport system permease protein